MVDARKETTIKIKLDENGEIILDQKNDVLFILSQASNLMFYMFDPSLP